MGFVSLQAAGLLQFFDDFAFVIGIIVFAYILFWLYASFRDVPILFGLASIVAAYFTILQPLPTIVLVVIFGAFIMMGMHFQMLIQFGVYPLLRFFGVEMEHEGMQEQQHMQAIEKKLSHGEELTREEEDFLKKRENTQQQYQQKVQNVLGRL
ncbi:MAG: hypothetical protein V1787_03545 [Candidatus Micrarchaeota archaeon]